MISPDRFQFNEPYAMRLVNKGAFMASFTVTDTELGIEFRDVRLINGKNGVFIGSPYREYEDKSKKTVRVDFWRPAYDFANKVQNPLGVEYVNAMTAAAVAYYEEKSNVAGTPAPAARPATRPAPAARASTGRGPLVPRPAATQASDGLPF